MQFQMAQTIRGREFALSFVERPCCSGANHRVFASEIMGDQVVRTPASANINLGGSSAYPVTVGIERVQKTGLVGASIWLDVPQRGLVYEEGRLHRAVMSPKPYGMPRSVVGAAKVRKFNHWLEPIKLSVHKTRAGLRTIRTEMFRWPQSSPQRREGCAYLKVATLKSDYNAGHPGRIN
jgi:hypothetical protein